MASSPSLGSKRNQIIPGEFNFKLPSLDHDREMQSPLKAGILGKAWLDLQ